MWIVEAQKVSLISDSAVTPVKGNFWKPTLEHAVGGSFLQSSFENLGENLAASRHTINALIRFLQKSKLEQRRLENRIRV